MKYKKYHQQFYIILYDDGPIVLNSVNFVKVVEQFSIKKFLNRLIFWSCWLYIISFLNIFILFYEAL